MKKTYSSSTQPDKNKSWEALQVAISEGNIGGSKF